MSYAVAQDLVLAFGEQQIIDLTDREDPPSGLIDAVVAERAIADANAEIDSYLGVRYQVPVSVQPDWLRAICCDITRYWLCGDRVTEEDRSRYEDALRWLRDVAAGRAQLVGALVPAGGAVAEQLVQAAPGRKVFGGGLL